MQLVADMGSRDDRRPKNIIAARTRLARKQAFPKVTQADLAARVEAYGVKINRLGIGRIEAGTRIVLDYEARAIAAALYVPVSWLIGEDEIYGSGEDIPKWPRKR